MRQFPTTPIDNDVIAPARTVKNLQHARKTVLADLSQKKKNICSGAQHDDTRDGCAGLWLCTDASEPQYTNVKKKNQKKEKRWRRFEFGWKREEEEEEEEEEGWRSSNLSHQTTN